MAQHHVTDPVSLVPHMQVVDDEFQQLQTMTHQGNPLRALQQAQVGATVPFVQTNLPDIVFSLQAASGGQVN